jgi:hypothetical protein
MASTYMKPGDLESLDAFLRGTGPTPDMDYYTKLCAVARSGVDAAGAGVDAATADLCAETAIRDATCLFYELSPKHYDVTQFVKMEHTIARAEKAKKAAESELLNVTNRVNQLCEFVETLRYAINAKADAAYKADIAKTEVVKTEVVKTEVVKIKFSNTEFYRANDGTEMMPTMMYIK